MNQIRYKQCASTFPTWALPGSRPLKTLASDQAALPLRDATAGAQSLFRRIPVSLLRSTPHVVNRVVGQELTEGSERGGKRVNLHWKDRKGRKKKRTKE